MRGVRIKLISNFRRLKRGRLGSVMGTERERERENVIIHMSNLVCYSHNDEQCLR